MPRIPKRGPMPKNLRLAPEEVSPTVDEVKKELFAPPGAEPLPCPETCSRWSDVWNEVSAGLTVKDTPVLETAFLARERLDLAQRSLKEEGPLVMNVKGEFTANPAAAMAERASATLLKAAAELGLSPSSRARLMRGAVVEDKPESPEVIMFGGEDG